MVRSMKCDGMCWNEGKRNEWLRFYIARDPLFRVVKGKNDVRAVCALQGGVLQGGTLKGGVLQGGVLQGGVL